MKDKNLLFKIKTVTPTAVLFFSPHCDFNGRTMISDPSGHPFYAKIPQKSIVLKNKSKF